MSNIKINTKLWTSNTCHLSKIEEVIYLRLIIEHYDDKLSLKDDIVKISRKIRMTEEIECVSLILKEFFTLNDRVWIPLNSPAYNQNEINKDQINKWATERAQSKIK